MRYSQQQVAAADNSRFSNKAVKVKYIFSYYVLLAYFFIEYIRPQDYFSIIGVISPTLFISGILSISWLINGDKKILKEPPMYLFLLLILQSAISMSYAVNYYYAYVSVRELTVYCFACVLPMIMVFTSHDRLFKFLNYWMLMHLFISVMSIMHRGKGSGSFLNDENDLALALNMFIPFPWLMLKSNGITRKRKIFYLITFIILIMGVITTFSRGGFLGLLSVIFGIILLSKNKFRNTIFLIVLCSIFYYLVSNKYVAEMETISDTGEATAHERLYSWKVGWLMFLDNPIIGVGAGNYPRRALEYELVLDMDRLYKPGRVLLGREAHSIYFTVLPECGLLGTIMFIAILYSLFRRLRVILKLENTPGLHDGIINDYCLIAKALLISLLGFLVTGAFISVFYYPEFWYLLGLVLMLERLTNQHLTKINAG